MGIRCDDHEICPLTSGVVSIVMATSYTTVAIPYTRLNYLGIKAHVWSLDVGGLNTQLAMVRMYG